MSDLESLVGRRVRHNCEAPDCPLRGKVVSVSRTPLPSNWGIVEEWVRVQWDPYQGVYESVPEGYTQLQPRFRVKVIDDE